MARKLRLTWVRSKIGTQIQHRGTIRSLGLRKLNQSVVVEDSHRIQGMIRTVRFMLLVEEVEA